MIIEQTGVTARPVSSGTAASFNARSVLWILWLIVAVWVTGPSFLTEVQYFRSPGPRYYRLLIIAFALSPAALWAFQRVRRGGFWRWEFALISSVPIAASFLYEPRAATVTVLVVLASFSLGRRTRRALGVDAASPAEDLAISIGIGLGLLQCALFFIGLARGYTVPVFLALLTGMLLTGRGQLREFWRDLGALHRAWAESAGELSSWPGALVTVFGAGLVVVGVMVMLAPSLAFDIVANHLTLAHYYAAHHALETPPYLRYGYYPQGIEVLMTLGYALAGDAAAQMLPAVYFVLSLLLAFRIGRQCGHDRFAAIAGTVFAFACPFIHWSGSVGKNDLAVAFFILAALHAYIRWRDTASFSQILAGAFFLAMAADVKQTVGLALVPIGLFFLYAASRQGTPWKAALKLVVVVLLFGSFWQIRTWVLKGNPFFPAGVPRTSVLKHPPPGLPLVVRAVAKTGLLVSDATQLGFESPLDRPAGVTLVLFVPLWFLARRRVNRAEFICLVFCAMYLLVWGEIIAKLRFAIAPVLIVTMLTGTRVVHYCRSGPQVVRVTLVAASAYVLTFGLLGAAIIEINAPQLRYFARRIDRTGYLREAMLSYRAMEFLKTTLAPGDRVLSLSSCALIYTPVPQAFDCVQAIHLDPDAKSPVDFRPYRFFLAPVKLQALIPAEGLKTVYSDETFLVREREGR